MGSSSEYVRHKVKENKIDRQKMMRLVHELEKKYHVDDYVDGRQIKFNDETIPDDDPKMMELHKIVGSR